MTKLRYLKVKDICGETYEFEDCEVKRWLGEIIVTYIVPLGTLKKVFYEKNIISIEYLLDDSKED